MRSLHVMRFVVAVVLGALGVVLPTIETARAEIVFGPPVHLGAPLNTADSDGSPSISADELTLYFDSDRPGGSGSWDIWMATRSAKDQPWGTPQNVGWPVNTWNTEAQPDISADGLSLFFMSDRAGGYGGRDLWVATRRTPDDPWGIPVNLGPRVNSAGSEGQPSISADGLQLYFHSNRSGGFQDLWVTTRQTIDSDWETPNYVVGVNSALLDQGPGISSNGLALFFESTRSGGAAPNIYVSTRPTVADHWQTPIYIDAINSSWRDADPDLSFDGRTLYFTSHRLEGFGYEDLWQTSLIPIVDFNGDGKVDGAEIRRLADVWGQYQPAYDVGPFPLGDGVVGVEDLAVLAEYIGTDITEPALIAHWTLDEGQGVTVGETVSGKEGMLFGNPHWRPDGGMVGGALQLDGKDNFVATNVWIDPSEGPLSVFAWVKGGRPGQVILAQETGANWLLANAADGSLATELIGEGRFTTPLLSQSRITDGQWHRVGLTWDGVTRALYVDDVVVAEDMQGPLPSVQGELYLGGGANLTNESLWSGMIDDVRIYSRCVRP